MVQHQTESLKYSNNEPIRDSVENNLNNAFSKFRSSNYIIVDAKTEKLEMFCQVFWGDVF